MTIVPIKLSVAIKFGLIRKKNIPKETKICLEANGDDFEHLLHG